MKNLKSVKKLNSAVIGLGVGEFHAETLYSNKNLNLIYICDKDIKKKLLIKKKFINCKFTKNPKKIFKDTSIDLVCIASYDNYHYKHRNYFF